MANKATMPLPDKFQKNMDMFRTFLNFACKQYDVMIKYRDEDLQSNDAVRSQLTKEIEQLFQLSDEEGLLSLN